MKFLFFGAFILVIALTSDFWTRLITGTGEIVTEANSGFFAYLDPTIVILFIILITFLLVALVKSLVD